MRTCPNCGTTVAEGFSTCGRCAQPPSSIPPPAGAPNAAPSASAAITAFIWSLIPCLCLYVVGLVLGIRALQKIKTQPERYTGKGFAVAAIVLSCVWLFVGTTATLASIAIPNFLRFQARAHQAEVICLCTKRRDADGLREGTGDERPVK